MTLNINVLSRYSNENCVRNHQDLGYEMHDSKPRHFKSENVRLTIIQFFEQTVIRRKRHVDEKERVASV